MDVGQWDEVRPPSMEPRLFSHGYLETSGIDHKDIVLQWSHGFSAMDTWRYRLTWTRLIAFNGATAFQPWIRGLAYLRFIQPVGLQWSHGFSAMDTLPTLGIAPALSSPSMEPRLFSHGYIKSELNTTVS